MGVNGYAILSGLLSGLGMAGSAVGSEFDRQRKEQAEAARLAQEYELRQQQADIQREQLAQQQRQFDIQQASAERDKYTDVQQLFNNLGIPLPATATAARIPTSIAPEMVKLAIAQQADAREQARMADAANFIRNSGAQPGQLTGRDAMLVPGEDPEAAAFLPMTQGRAALTPDELVAGLMQRGNKAADISSLMKILRPDAEEKTQLVSDTTRGFLRNGQFTEIPRDAAATMTEPPTPRPGYEVVRSWDKNGLPTYREERITTGVDRDALAQAQGYASFAAAPQDAKARIDKEVENRSLVRSQQQGAAAQAAKPLTEDEQKRLGGATASLAAADQIKGFSDAEIGRYVGLLNKPLAEVQQTLAGMGMGKADQRFIEFKSAVGRMQQAMFDTAGKALTETERKVLISFIPTGDEPNAQALRQKVNAFSAVTEASRAIQLDLARKGRGSIDPAEYDRRIREAMATVSTPPAATGTGGWTIKRVQ